ncbi:MAG: Uma2 family endonuclease [Coleofasciculaceae cyanobacterium]
MSLAQDLEATKDIPEDVIFPPEDLYSDEPPLETYLHLQQMLLLIKCLDWWWRDRNDFFCTGNLTIYYSPHQRKSEDFRGPDFFVVLATERKPRKSWVVWHEDGKYPNIIVEILSSTTAATDKDLKKQIYQDTFRTPDYFWFDPDNLEFAGFHLIDGEYQPLEPNPQGLLWSQQLQLYLGIHQKQLRFFTAENELVPTPEEVAIQATQKAEQATQKAEQATQKADQATQKADQATQKADQATQKADRLAAKLRELNIDPDTI